MSERVHFEITADNELLTRKLSESRVAFRNFTSVAEQEGQRIESSFSKIGATIGGVLSFAGASSFVSKMYQIRSSFQDTEASMKVFLGSAEKAQKFVKELQDYAWYNMFEFSDLTQESTKLLAFGNDVKDIIPILDKLSNIAAGTKQPLSELVNLYNKGKNVGKIGADSLESWANKGVVITDVLKEMGIEVDRSNIKFEHLDMVLNHLTSDGGMFAGLMAEQLPYLSASMGQLEDDITNMFNELGTKYQDTMKAGIEFASEVVGNYEQVGRVIGQVVVVYGTYRAALLATYAIQKAVAVYRDVQAFRALAKELGTATVAQTLFNTAAWTNPYVWIGAAIALIGGITASILLWNDSQEETAETIGEIEQGIRNEHKEVNALVQKLTLANTAESERKRILAQLRDLQPSLVDGIEDEEDAIEGVVDRLKEYNEEYGKRAALGRYQDKVNEAQDTRNNAGVEVNVARSELEKSIATLYGNFDKIEMQGRTTAWSDELKPMSEEEKAAILSEIDSFINDTSLTIEQRAEKLKNVLYNEAFSVSELLGRMSVETMRTPIGPEWDAFLSSLETMHSAVSAEASAERELANARANLATAAGSEALTIKPSEEEQKAVNDYKERVSALADEIVRLQGEIKALRNGGDLGEYNSVSEAVKAKEEELKGKTTSYKNLTGIDYEAQQKKRKEAAEAIKKSSRKLELEVAQSEIDAMEEGTTRKLAQINLDLQKTLAAIDEEERELKKKYKEAGKRWTNTQTQQFETRRTNARTASANETADVREEQERQYQALLRESTDIFKTEEQRKINAIRRAYEERRKAYKDKLDGGDITQEQYNTLVDNSNDSEWQEINDFVTMDFKTVEQRKKEIVEKYQTLIDAIPAECQENIDNANRMMNEELANIDLEELKKRINWDEVFGDFGKQTTLSLQNTLAKLKAFVADAQKSGADLSEIPGLKDVVNQITAIEDELDNRNPFVALFESMGEIATAKQEVASAAGELIDAQRQMNEVNEQIKLGNLTQDSAEYKRALDNLTKAENRYNTATNKQMSATKKFASSLKSSGTIVKSIGTDIADLASVFDEDLGNSIKKGVNLFGTILDSAESVVNAISDVTVKTVGTVENTVSAASTAMTATAAAGAASMSTLEKASVILAVISAALQIATAIASLFNRDDDLQEDIEESQRRVEQLRWEMENLEAIEVDKAIGGWDEMFKKLHHNIIIAAFATGDFNKVMDSMSASSIPKNKEAINSIVQTYANLDYTMGKALGEDKYKQSRSQLESLAKQQAETYAQLQAEEEKKKTDQSAVEEYKRQIAELGAEMKAVLDDMTEDIIGGSASDIANQLGDAFFEAFGRGEDAADAWGKKVDEIVQDIVKRMLITKYLEPKIGEIFDKYQDDWFDKEGNFLGIDTVLASMTGFSNDLKALGEEFNQISTAVNEGLDNVFEPGEEATEKSGFATASQESIDELTGKFTALQIIGTMLNASAQERNQILNALYNDIATMRSNSNQMLEHTEDIRTMIIQSVMYLKEISENTSSLLSIESKISKMNDTLKNKL